MVKGEDSQEELDRGRREKALDNKLYLKRSIQRSGLEVDAFCKRTEEGFVVLKGSKLELINSDSIPKRIKEDRAKADIDENGILQEDILYKSPSYAGAFVIGGHINGQTCWKNSDGVMLRDIEKKESEI